MANYCKVHYVIKHTGFLLGYILKLFALLIELLGFTFELSSILAQLLGHIFYLFYTLQLSLPDA